MKKIYCSLGLMSGTSADGVDASIINSDGDKEYEVILNKYFKYNQKIYENIHSLKEKINSSKDLKIFSKEIMSLEKEITLFHANVVDEIIQESKSNVDFIGFHGQTIFHNSKERISKQLGDGKILSQLTKKIIVCNFRENDLNNGGEGAPLAPIFHKLIINQHKISLPVCVLNIGGIANITAIERNDYSNFISRDIGPGNCLIDEWIRKNTKKKYDDNGLIAKKGKTNEIILNQAFDNFNSRKKNNVLSFDTKDFNLNFALRLSLEEGAATLTDFTGRIIGAGLFNLLSRTSDKLWKVLVCGAGRKNTTLMNCFKKKTLKNIDIQLIDDYGIDGDFVESQAFAYLAIRSYLKLPISFPETTGCKKPCIGGEIIKNF